MRYTKLQKEQAIELRASGLTFKEIAKRLNIANITTVSNFCDATKLKKKPYSKRENYKPGNRYNNFVLVRIAFNKESCQEGKVIPYWECKCDCGNTFFIATKHMRTRHKSCGCISKSNRFKKLEPKQVIGRIRYNHYKQGAARRKLLWNLSIEDFTNLLFSKCYYCNILPFTLVKSKNHKAIVSGVDRINSDFGYELNNCVSCCKFCNRAKGNAKLEDFLNWIENLRRNN